MSEKASQHQVIRDISQMRKRRELEEFAVKLLERVKSDINFYPYIEVYTNNEKMEFTSEVDEAHLAESLAVFLRSR